MNQALYFSRLCRFQNLIADSDLDSFYFIYGEFVLKAFGKKLILLINKATSCILI